MAKYVRTWKFSRSHDETYLDCNRKGYLNYYFGGTGIVRKGLNLEMATGSLTHAILKPVMEVAKEEERPPERQQMNEICSVAVEDYKREVAEKGFDEVSGEVELEMVRQAALAEGLSRVWTKVRLPYILENYNILSVEEEHDVDIGDGQFIMSRPDVTLQRKVDGELFAGPEFKTTGWISDSYIESWRYSCQTLSHSLDVMDRYGKMPMGVAMEFLYKGVRRSSEDGGWVYYSPLLRGYKMTDEMGQTVYGYDSSLSRKRDWHAFDAAVLGMETWVDQLPQEILEGMLFNTVVMRNPKELELWLKQVKIRQARIQAALIQLFEDTPSQEAAAEIMATVFPAKMDRSCYDNKYHKKCPYLDICYGKIADPIESGKYVEREPHHPGEFE